MNAISEIITLVIFTFHLYVLCAHVSVANMGNNNTCTVDGMIKICNLHSSEFNDLLTL